MVDGAQGECGQARCEAVATRVDQHERVLERSHRALLAWVGEDLRTPLAELRTLSDALQNGLVEDRDVYYKQIGLTVDRLGIVIEDLLDLTRVAGDPGT